MMRHSSVLAGIAVSIGLATAPAGDLQMRRAELIRAHEQMTSDAAIDFIGTISSRVAEAGFYTAALRPFGKGPAAARSFLERDTLNRQSRAIVTVVRLDVSADGNDGYSYGYLDVIRARGDTLPGAFKAYWRRGGDGRWLALAFGRSPRQAGPLVPLPDSLQDAASAYRAWPAKDSTEAWSSLRATEMAFSDSARGDMRAAFMSFAAPDAAKIAGSSYVFGRPLIGEGFRNPPPAFQGFSWRAEWGTVSAGNDLGFNVGPVTVANAPNGGGLFFTIWKRQANGEWRYLVD
jgi:hypothetical protein